MMKKTIILMFVLLALTASLSAQVTREQANEIVLNHAQSAAPQCSALYAGLNAPTGDGIEITTSNEETFRAKYACWAYCLEESGRRRYLFVKEEGGSLLEVVASNDVSELDASWEIMAIPNGLVDTKINMKSLYPNPVGDWLTLPCGENDRVEIYDLKGTRLFSGTLSGDQLNVSFLKPGTYMVKVDGETYKIIKN